MENEKIEYKVVVDTDKYAGNFEREMTAFMTGVVGDCEVGSELQKTFQIECSEDICFEMDNLIAFRLSPHVVYRPCAICENEDKEYNSFEIYLEKKPKKHLFELMRERAYKYAKNKILYDSLIYGEELASKRGTLKILNVKLIEVKTIVKESEVEL